MSTVRDPRVRRSYGDVMRIQNGDVGLDVRIDGDDDAPALLVMHGILGSAQTWEWMVPRLINRHRVLRLDFRGHGGSDRAPGAYRLADYVSDAVAVCERVAGSPVAVIGHSLGGATAAGLAQTRPDLVKGILMEDAPLAAPDLEAVGDERNALLDGFALMRQMIPQVQAAGMPAEQVAALTAAAPYAGGRPLGELLLDDALAAMGAETLAVDASVLDPVLDGTMSWVFDPSRPIEVPVVAVAADPAQPDAVTTPADLERLEATSPDVQTHTLVGANHLIHSSKDHREAFWSIVDEFLDGRSGRR